MNIMTYRLTLVPDDRVPGFDRFRFDTDYVPLQDVFHRGIHPAITDPHSKAMEIIQNALNDKACIPQLLEQWTHPVAAYHQTYDKDTAVVTCLKEIAKTCYFVNPEVAYEDVFAQATKWVETHWDQQMAHRFVIARSGDFCSIRDFLKQFKPDIKLCGFADVDAYELHKFVPFDVFRKMDRTIVGNGMQLHNYRLKTALAKITDADGRLRLCTEVKHCIVDTGTRIGEYHRTTYHCEVHGDTVIWRPHLTMTAHGDNNREKAKAIAKKFGGGTGTFCFRTSLATMSKMLDDSDQFKLSFPSLRYGLNEKPGDAEAYLRKETIETWGVHSNIHGSHANDDLKKVLQALGEQVGGRKQVLAERIVKAAIREYQQQEAVIDQFFKDRRFIRVPGSSYMKTFVALPEHPLGSLLVHVWVLQHMRGNTILDAQYKNTSVPLEDRIRAVVDHRQEINGGFIRAL